MIRLGMLLVSDGTTGQGWIVRLQDQGLAVSDRAKSLLNSSDFRPTDGSAYRIVITKPKLQLDGGQAVQADRTDLDRRSLAVLNPEAACLIREYLSDDDLASMGLLWIVTMHVGIADYGGTISLLTVTRGGDGRRLGASVCSMTIRADRTVGSAFALG